MHHIRRRATGPLEGETLILALFAIPLVILTGALLWRSTLLIPINFNEGWNAYWAHAAATGQPLYLPWSTFRANNYPSLSFYIVALATTVIPDPIFAGRALSWIAFFGIGALIHPILRRVGNDRAAALCGALTFHAFMASQYSAYVGMDDPQLLAQLVTCAGFLLLIGRGRRTGVVILAAIVIAAGLFIKHNIVALPVSIAVWLWRHDRARLVPYAATLAACGLFGLGACQAHFGSNFIHDLLLPRRYSMPNGVRKITDWLTPMQLPVFATALLQTPALRDPFAEFCGLYVAASTLVAFLAAGGNGINENAAFEIVVAFALGFGHFIGRLAGPAAGRPPRYLRPLAIALVGTSLLCFGLNGHVSKALLVVPWVRHERVLQRQTRAYVRAMARAPGPGLCETLALCYWAGKPFAVSFFNLMQAGETRATARGAERLLAEIGARHFAAIQIRWRASPRFRQVLRRHYRLVRTAGRLGGLYRPDPD